MPESSLYPVQVHRYPRDQESNYQADLLAVEEPLEIRLGFGELSHRQSISLSVTMRTPGQDLELVQGFLFSEGIIQEKKDIVHIAHCQSVEKIEERNNVVRVELSPKILFKPKNHQQLGIKNSACGVCGKQSLENLQKEHRFLEIGNFKIARAQVYRLPQILQSHQAVFSHTGGLHAAALLDQNVQIVALKEDVGRHNALDKLIGGALEKDTLALSEHGLLLSGRVSYELVQKALRARIPFIAAMGAPSSLALQIAQEFGISLLGFVKSDKFNIYCGSERISP